MPKLTKSIVDKADLRPKQYTVWCSELKGFGVYIHPTGNRTYFVDYRTADGARRRMTIGKHGMVTTDQARKLAIETMGGIVLKRGDPLAERKTRRNSLTISELCDRYWDVANRGGIFGKKGVRKKASTLEIDKGRIERHIKPLLGSKLVIDVTRADIVKFVRDVSIGKTAVRNRTGKNGARVDVKGGAGTASRTTGFLGGIMTFAVNEGIITSNPVRGVALPSDNVRDKRLTPEEFRKLGDALATEESSLDTPQAITGAWLLALTGCRLGEVEKLKWSEVDEAGGALRLEDTKSGPSVRPAGQEVFVILKDALRSPGNPYVLPALHAKGHYTGLGGSWVRLMKRAGLTGVTPHTMRHSFASVAGDLGYADSTIGALIGHAGGTVTSKYVHRLDSVLVAAANKVCGEIYRQMTGRTADILTLPKRA